MAGSGTEAGFSAALYVNRPKRAGTWPSQCCSNETANVSMASGFCEKETGINLKRADECVTSAILKAYV